MNGRIARFSRICASLLAVLGLALVMSGQEQSPEKHVGLVTDWSSRHIAFSPPSSPLVATQVGQDPRYWQQWARRNMHPAIPDVKTDADPFARDRESVAEPKEPESENTESADVEGETTGLWGFGHDPKALKKDWSVQMGATAAMGDLNYPAKYSFSTSTASCNDYVTYNTGLPPTGTGGTAATGSFTIETDPSGWATGTVTVTVASGATTQTYTFVTSVTNATANQDFIANTGLGATTDEDDQAKNLEAVIDNAQGDCGYGTGTFGTGDCFSTATTTNLLVSATVSGKVVTVTALSVGTAGNSITISTSNDTDIFLNGVKQTSAVLTGGTNPPPEATLIGYNNLYTGTCTGVPTVAFAYNTGGTVTTSPVISLDGTQIMFVQNSTSNAAQLVLLKPSLTSGGTFNAPVTPTAAASAAAYRTCAAPCMWTITFALDAGAQGSDGLAASGSGGSSVWEDYAFDNAYVGDDNGYMHKFTGAFTGTPAEAASPWPVAVTGATSANNSTPLTSPVFDETHGVLYFGDFGAREDYITTATGALVVSAAIGSNTNDLYDAPLVDPSSGTNGFVYQTAIRNGAASAVVQLAGKFASGNAGTVKAVGTVGSFIYTGTFDNLYYSGATTGHLYVCGAADPTIYEIPITTATGALGTTVTLTTTLTGANAATCSSVTEAFNGTVDYIYTSVTAEGVNSGGGTGCSAATRGCVFSYNTTAALTAASTPAGSLYSPGGTSGIIIDNFSSGGGSQIYYSPLGGGTGADSCGAATTTGCAVQAAQGTGL